MSRFFKFAFSAIFALVAFVAVARAGEVFYDEDGNELKVFDSGAVSYTHLTLPTKRIV